MLDRPTGHGPNDEADERAAGALLRALRRARVEAAERTDVVVDLRQAEIARLEMLKEELEPVFAQVPRDVDLFDVGLSGGERPRLFIDMVSFVEMARDKRTYRFMRDGRHGRAVAAESDKPDDIVEAITSYVARRLIERERLLADDDRLSSSGAAPTPAAPTSAATTATVERASAAEPAAAPALAALPAEQPARKGRTWLRVFAILTAFAFGGALGAAVVIACIIAVAKGYIPI